MMQNSFSYIQQHCIYSECDAYLSSLNRLLLSGMFTARDLEKLTFIFTSQHFYLQKFLFNTLFSTFLQRFAYVLLAYQKSFAMYSDNFKPLSYSVKIPWAVSSDCNHKVMWYDMSGSQLTPQSFFSFFFWQLDVKVRSHSQTKSRRCTAGI